MFRTFLFHLFHSALFYFRSNQFIPLPVNVDNLDRIIFFIIETDTVLLFTTVSLFGPTKHLIISFALMDIQKFCNQRIHLSSRSVKYVNIQKQKESEVKSMGIFSGLFKSRDKPQNRTSGRSEERRVGKECRCRLYAE